MCVAWLMSTLLHVYQHSYLKMYTWYIVYTRSTSQVYTRDEAYTGVVTWSVWWWCTHTSLFLSLPSLHLALCTSLTSTSLCFTSSFLHSLYYTKEKFQHFFLAGWLARLHSAPCCWLSRSPHQALSSTRTEQILPVHDSTLARHQDLLRVVFCSASGTS